MFDFEPDKLELVLGCDSLRDIAVVLYELGRSSFREEGEES